MHPYLTFPYSTAPRRAASDPALDHLFGFHDPNRRIARSIGTISTTSEPVVPGLLIWDFHLVMPSRPTDPVQDAAYQEFRRGMEKMLLELLPKPASSSPSDGIPTIQKAPTSAFWSRWNIYLTLHTRITL